MNRRMYYKTCPNCGAHLDTGERCDCERDTEREVTTCHMQKDA